MVAYDVVADAYDAHFNRPVDRWEDERLTELLRPHVDKRFVLDLGCGTGWVLDHLHPWNYVGVDASAAMLEILRRKHPGEITVKATIGANGWLAEVDDRWPGRIETVVSTWAAHDFGDLALLLQDLRHHLYRGTIVALHGQAPRYKHRAHYVLDGDDEKRGYLRFTPKACERAAFITGAHLLSCAGIGALPDRLAYSHTAWRAALAAPPRYHYSFLALWRL